MPRKKMTPIQLEIKPILKVLKADTNARHLTNSSFRISHQNNGAYHALLQFDYDAAVNNGARSNVALQRVEQQLRSEIIMTVLYPLVKQHGKPKTWVGVESNRVYWLDTQALVSLLESIVAESPSQEVIVAPSVELLVEVTRIMEATQLPQATLARLAGIDKRKFYNKLSEGNRAQFNQRDVAAIVTGLSKLSRVIINLTSSG